MTDVEFFDDSHLIGFDPAHNFAGPQTTRAEMVKRMKEWLADQLEKEVELPSLPQYIVSPAMYKDIIENIEKDNEKGELYRAWFGSLKKEAVYIEPFSVHLPEYKSPQKMTRRERRKWERKKK